MDTGFQGLFEQFLGLVGQRIRVGLLRSGEQLVGAVTYSMFDSFILRTEGGDRVISFSDISFVETTPAGES